MLSPQLSLDALMLKCASARMFARTRGNMLQKLSDLIQLIYEKTLIIEHWISNNVSEIIELRRAVDAIQPQLTRLESKKHSKKDNMKDHFTDHINSQSTESLPKTPKGNVKSELMCNEMIKVVSCVCYHY